MSDKNEAKFDKLKERFEALVNGNKTAAEEAAERAAIEEYGVNVSENLKEQIAEDNFDEDGETLRGAAANIIFAVEREGDFTDIGIQGIRGQVANYETHLRKEHGDDLVDEWVE